ncbi:MAG: tRNA lysidine(34) synthetase TilS, partial [Hyphomicrobium sp.]
MTSATARRSSQPIADDELDGLFWRLGSQPLALAVSGGADSTALMHLVARWARRPDVVARYRESWLGLTVRTVQTVAGDAERGAPEVDWSGLARPGWLPDPVTVESLRAAGGTPHVVVLTVDHGLRKTSASDAAFVAQEAAKLGLGCTVLRWDGEKPATGIQEAARHARRDLMLDVLRAERGIVEAAFRRQGLNSSLDRTLVMAHHQEDQAETVLMRLMRGSGLEGLGGMRARDNATRSADLQRPQRFEAEVVRPLLDLPKARLVATLEAHGVSWLEDPSNEDHRFERVRVRKALATLGDVGLSAEKIALSARRLRDAEQALQTIGARDGEGLGDARNPCYPHMGDVALLLRWTPYLLVRTLRGLIRIYGGGARPAELSQIEKLAERMYLAEAAIEFSGATLGGCKFELSDCEDGTHLLDWRLRIRVFREGAGQGLPVAPIRPGQTVEWDGGRFTITATPDAPPGCVVRALGVRGWADLKRRVPALE